MYLYVRKEHLILPETSPLLWCDMHGQLLHNLCQDKKLQCCVKSLTTTFVQK